MTRQEDRTARQFVLYCRTALRYEKLNYYNEHKRESYIDTIPQKQSGTACKFSDTYYADYFQTMGHEIGITDGDLTWALRELPDRKMQIVMMYYFIGLNDREIGEIFGIVRSRVCEHRNKALRMLRLLMEGIYHGE